MKLTRSGLLFVGIFEIANSISLFLQVYSDSLFIFLISSNNLHLSNNFSTLFKLSGINLFIILPYNFNLYKLGRDILLSLICFNVSLLFFILAKGSLILLTISENKILVSLLSIYFIIFLFQVFLIHISICLFALVLLSFYLHSIYEGCLVIDLRPFFFPSRFI